MNCSPCPLSSGQQIKVEEGVVQREIHARMEQETAKPKHLARSLSYVQRAVDATRSNDMEVGSVKLGFTALDAGYRHSPVPRVSQALVSPEACSSASSGPSERHLRQLSEGPF